MNTEQKQIAVRAYTLAEHTGFGACFMERTSNKYLFSKTMSIATCKADMRGMSTMREGLWIAAFTPTRMTLRLAFLMHVDRILDRADYWRKYENSRIDSIYKPNSNKRFGFEQIRNDWHGPDRQAEDMKSNRVLWSQNFMVFANSYDYRNRLPSGIKLPKRFEYMARGGMRRYGQKFEVPESFLEWARRQHSLTTFQVIDRFEGKQHSRAGSEPKQRSTCMQGSCSR